MSLKKDTPNAVTLLQAVIFVQFSASFFITVMTTVGISFGYTVSSYYLMAFLQAVLAVPGMVHIALQGNVWVALYISFQLVASITEIFWLIYMICDNQSALRWVGLGVLTAINISAVIIALWFRQKTFPVPGKKSEKCKSKKNEKDSKNSKSSTDGSDKKATKQTKPKMETPSRSMNSGEKSSATSARSSKESPRTSPTKNSPSGKSSPTSNSPKSPRRASRSFDSLETTSISTASARSARLAKNTEN